MKIKENEIQYKKIVEEERIISMDITLMLVRLQQYYKSLQDEIMALMFLNSSGGIVFCFTLQVMLTLFISYVLKRNQLCDSARNYRTRERHLDP